MKCPVCKEVALRGKYKELGACASCYKAEEEKTAEKLIEALEKLGAVIPPEPYTRRQIGPAIERKE